MRQASKRIPESAEKTVRDIRRATRRHHSAEEKIRIVLEGLRGEVSIAELCRIRDSGVEMKSFAAALPSASRACLSSRQMGLDDRDRHDVEDAAGVRVFGVGQFLVAPALVVGRLNLAVDLPAIGAFEIDAVVAVGGDGAADGRVGDLLLGDLLDVERFLVA